MTYKDSTHPDYRSLWESLRELTNPMIYQRAQDCLKWAVSTENLEAQGITPSRSSQSYRDESAYLQGYLQKRLAGLTDDEIQQATEGADRA